MLKIGAFALAAAAVLATAAPSQAATYLQVGPNALCASGGCFGEGNSFQKVYSAAGQSGPVSISSLVLDKSVLGGMDDFAVKIGFSLSDGTKVGDWGAYTFAVLGGQIVQVGGPAFTWDTNKGDLVLTLSLVVPEKGGAGGGGFGGGGGGGGGFGGGGEGSGLSVDNGGASVGEGAGVAAWNNEGTHTGMGSDVIVSNLPASVAPISSLAVVVPEPSAWALMLAGFGAAGTMLRMRRRHFKYS